MQIAKGGEPHLRSCSISNSEPAKLRGPPELRISLSNFEFSFRSDLQEISNTLHQMVMFWNWLRVKILNLDRMIPNEIPFPWVMEHTFPMPWYKLSIDHKRVDLRCDQAGYELSNDLPIRVCDLPGPAFLPIWLWPSQNV
jgi:hypothetical protein